MNAYKVFTHDLRSPIQGGNPIWDGRLPFDLPVIKAGWNACKSGAVALRIGGLWPDGRPSRLFRVKSVQPVIERGDKLRSASWRIVEEVDDVTPHVLELSKPFGNLAQEMTEQQMAWREALSRPNHDKSLVVSGLENALKIRGLKWRLKEFRSVRNARNARAAWGAMVSKVALEARDAWGAMDALDARVALDARDAWNAWAAMDAWKAWDARTAWAAMDAWKAWDAMGAWDAMAAWGVWTAWAAMDALTMFYSAKMEWVSCEPTLLTTGLRKAYRNGLCMVLPTKKNQLGFVMEEK